MENYETSCFIMDFCANALKFNRLETLRKHRNNKIEIHLTSILICIHEIFQTSSAGATIQIIMSA